MSYHKRRGISIARVPPEVFRMKVIRSGDIIRRSGLFDKWGNQLFIVESTGKLCAFSTLVHVKPIYLYHQIFGEANA